MSNSTESNTLSDPLNWTAGLLMTLNGIFGLVTNSVIIHNFFSSFLERTSFNLICTFRAVANFIILGVGFLATFVPLTIIGDDLFPPVYHSTVITIVNSLYTGLQYCGFLIAVNRFFAVFFVFLYQTYFTIEVAFVLASIVFAYRIFRMAEDIIQSIETQCFATYSSEWLAWFPTSDEKCFDKYADVVDGSIIILVALILINIATFMKMYFFYKRTGQESKEMKQRLRRNRIMFTQTILQDLTYLIDMLFTFKLMGLFFVRYWTFISGSLIWESVHSFDGLIMIMFNEKLTFMKSRLFSHSSPVASSVPPLASISVIIPSARSYPAPIN